MRKWLWQSAKNLRVWDKNNKKFNLEKKFKRSLIKVFGS